MSPVLSLWLFWAAGSPLGHHKGLASELHRVTQDGNGPLRGFKPQKCAESHIERKKVMLWPELTGLTLQEFSGWS